MAKSTVSIVRKKWRKMMKNKHQYALDNIGSTYFTMNYVANEKLRLDFEKMYNEYKQTLQELVDKATPKKPIDNSWSYDCPSCNFKGVINLGIGYKFCSNCGQAIDWSNNED